MMVALRDRLIRNRLQLRIFIAVALLKSPAPVIARA